MKRDEAIARAKILKALANPTRLMMVEELSKGDRCVTDLRFLARVDPSVISRHLAQLKHAGILTEKRAGLRVIQHLECPCILQALECTIGVMQAEVTRKSRVAAANEAKG
ncbi:MAG: metalloregulator ArsR/SmtB family transcription factor [Kiritimatiellaeota bacterium]|nr:metalloregulator ArsR/SmtB family transcription factor [Kiritimatiellota bacterium]